jgi:hypothetical protein
MRHHRSRVGRSTKSADSSCVALSTAGCWPSPAGISRGSRADAGCARSPLRTGGEVPLRDRERPRRARRSTCSCAWSSSGSGAAREFFGDDVRRRGTDMARSRAGRGPAAAARRRALRVLRALCDEEPSGGRERLDDRRDVLGVLERQVADLAVDASPNLVELRRGLAPEQRFDARLEPNLARAGLEHVGDRALRHIYFQGEISLRPALAFMSRRRSFFHDSSTVSSGPVG